MKKLTACLSLFVLFASCASDHKKVIVISEGTADVNTDNRTITTKGRGHEEKTVLFYESGDMDIKINSAAGSATVSLKDNGVYFINTKRDTIVGSYVNYTAPKTVGKKISIEEMEQNIDSLEQILAGKAQYGKTYFILPNQAVKITDNKDATIVTPYHQMTSIEVKKGQTPEVYRFYPISETRTTLNKLKDMMGLTDKPVNDPKKK